MSENNTHKLGARTLFRIEKDGVPMVRVVDKPITKQEAAGYYSRGEQPELWFWDEDIEQGIARPFVEIHTRGYRSFGTEHGRRYYNAAPFQDINPLSAPEGLPELRAEDGKPLVYIGKGPWFDRFAPEKSWLFYSDAGKKWSEWYCGIREHHYAIDPTDDEAREAFPLHCAIWDEAQAKLSAPAALCHPCDERGGQPNKKNKAVAGAELTLTPAEIAKLRALADWHELSKSAEAIIGIANTLGGTPCGKPAQEGGAE